VQLAIWFHDLIYDPKSKENEELSAIEFEKFAKNQSTLKPQDIKTVYNYILYTKDHKCPKDDFDAQLFLDYDLAILASPPHMYEEYRRGIRKEYDFVPLSDFATKRSKVLVQLLSKPSLYETHYFGTKKGYEKLAGWNMKREVQDLEPISSKESASWNYDPLL